MDAHQTRTDRVLSLKLGFILSIFSSMPPKAASSGRTKHKSTLKLDSLPPPKKFKAAKGVTILSVRYHMYRLRDLTLTQVDPYKLSSCPPLSPTSQPSFALKPPKTVSVAAKDAKGKGKAACDVSEESKGTLRYLCPALEADWILPKTISSGWISMDRGLCKTWPCTSAKSTTFVGGWLRPLVRTVHRRSSAYSFSLVLPVPQRRQPYAYSREKWALRPSNTKIPRIQPDFLPFRTSLQRVRPTAFLSFILFYSFRC